MGKYYSENEVLSLLQISNSTLYRYIESGRLEKGIEGFDQEKVNQLLNQKRQTDFCQISHLARLFNITRYKMEKLILKNKAAIRTETRNDSRKYYNLRDVKKAFDTSFVNPVAPRNYKDKVFLLQLWKRGKVSNSHDWLCRPVRINNSLDEILFRTNTGEVLKYQQVLKEGYSPCYHLITTKLPPDLHPKYKRAIYLKFTWEQAFQVQYKQVLDFFLSNFRKSSIKVYINENIIVKILLNVKSADIKKGEWSRLIKHSNFMKNFENLFVSYNGIESKDVTFKVSESTDCLQIELNAPVEVITIQVKDEFVEKLRLSAQKNNVDPGYLISDIATEFIKKNM